MNLDVSGTFTGTGTWNYGGPCPAFHQWFDGTYTTENGRTGSFHVDGCVTIPSPPPASPQYPFSGTFTLTSPDGQTMNGTAVGTITATVPEGTLNITLTLAGGKFSNVGGVISLTGTLVTEHPGEPGAADPISGVLAGALTPRWPWSMMPWH